MLSEKERVKLESHNNKLWATLMDQEGELLKLLRESPGSVPAEYTRMLYIVLGEILYRRLMNKDLEDLWKKLT